MTRYAGGMLTVCLLLAAPAAAQVRLTLEPIPEAPHPPGPYRMARLTVSTAAAARVEQVHLRWAEGGPTYILDMPVAGGASQSRDLPLPAAWARQSYQAKIFPWPDDEPAPAVEIVWASMQALEPFPDARMYDPFEQDAADWPPRLKRNLFLLLAVGALAGISATLLRSGALRLASVAAMVLGVSIGAFVLLRQAPLTIHRSFDVQAYGADLDLHVITARRSTVWTGDDVYVPRYRNFGQIIEDRTRIHVGRGIAVPLGAGDLRIFQRIDAGSTFQRSSARPTSPSSRSSS